MQNYHSQQKNNNKRHPLPSVKVGGNDKLGQLLPGVNLRGHRASGVRPRLRHVLRLLIPRIADPDEGPQEPVQELEEADKAQTRHECDVGA